MIIEKENDMRCGDKYIINKNTKVVIYGAATTGAILYHNLSEAGHEVIAFIDKRADEIDTYYGLTVWNFKEAQESFRTNADIVVIIGIKNVFEHEKIAKLLWEKDCKKIIFRPHSVVDGGGNEKEKKLNDLYDQAMAGQLTYCFIIDEFGNKVLKDNAVILEEDEYIVANIPSHYIFTDKYENKEILWGDIPCIGLVPHIGLFNLFLGNKNDDYKEYMLFCREAANRSGGIVMSKAWEESVYINRLDVFNHMQYAWEHNRDFFVKKAVEAEFNEKGYFNIKSGKHRVIYQLIKGSQYIPLRIKKSEYKKWENKERASKINKILQENSRDSLPLILGNPYCYDYSCNSSYFYKKILDELILMVFRKQYYCKREFVFSDQKILFYNTPLSMYSDVFLMLGFEVSVCEQDSVNRELIDVLTDGHCDYFDPKYEECYAWGVIQGEIPNEIKVDNLIHISDTEKVEKEEIARGFVEGKIMFAYK